MLYRRGASAASVSEKSALLPQALKELGTSAEEMVVALEQLSQQQKEIERSQQQLNSERQRYQLLFEEAPDAYLVTDSAGTIRELNRAAAKLLNCSRELLLGKPLSVFVPKEERLGFREQFQQRRSQASQAMKGEWHLRLSSPYREPFNAAVTIAPEMDGFNNLISVRLCVREVCNIVQKPGAQGIHPDDPISDRTRQSFAKGDLIPLNAEGIWVVCQGWVKLSTLTEKNEEILMGLVGVQSPFGSTLTALPIYQATAISRTVEVVNISTNEIATSPRLSEFMYYQLNQRLHQTQLLLAVCGRRRVIERLIYLLEVLKSIAGEPVPEGIRLSVRLTHQELADTCCTTRVTMTRLLGDLQKDGKIAIDCDSHIILTYY